MGGVRSGTPHGPSGLNLCPRGTGVDLCSQDHANTYLSLSLDATSAFASYSLSHDVSNLMPQNILGSQDNVHRENKEVQTVHLRGLADEINANVHSLLT